MCFGYCISHTVGINLNDSHIQCALNHSGVLCGGCLPGLSLAIGSSRCMDCTDNDHVALLVAFIVAGIVLVLFIKVFDLTVAHGTINGLIFYANAVWINQGIFYSNVSGHNNEILSQFFDIMNGFIAWLNLDFGIESCFFNGLDAYWKTWLQFAFPLYLWFLAGLIVFLCHYSIRATKLFGNNAVGVLCTVILLSYVKLLKTIVSALSPAVLQQFDRIGTRWVWLLDGNVSYLGASHMGLFSISILVLLLIWLPYTLLLLFVRFLHSIPRASHLMIKLKPFLDCYTGPLKAKHQYWVGLTLFARVILAVISIAYQAINPRVSIDVLGLISAILCVLVINVYKNSYIACVELLFLFNIITLCFAFLSTDVAETSSFISSTVCFLMFIFIVLYHVYCACKKCYGEQNNGYVSVPGENSVEPNKTQTNVNTTTTFVDIREPLLSPILIKCNCWTSLVSFFYVLLKVTRMFRDLFTKLVFLCIPYG